MGGRCKAGGGGEAEDGRRRYPHVERAKNAVKLSHNQWVLESAVEHGTDVLILDGLDLNTTGILIRGGIPQEKIHVPNRPDYDALMKRERGAFGGGAAGAAPTAASGHVYRATAQEFVAAYASLTAPRRPIKTVWLDLNARWGLHVERTIRQIFESRMLGVGRSDLFLTLSRGFHAKQIDAVTELVRGLFAEVFPKGSETLDLVEDHSSNYGTGMMILHWRVQMPGSFFESFFGPRDAAPLADRLAKETKQFRKPQNLRRASDGDGVVDTVAVGSRDAECPPPEEGDRWLDSLTACACADMADMNADGGPMPVEDIPLTEDGETPVRDDPPCESIKAPIMDDMDAQTADGGGFGGPQAGVPIRTSI